ncbi:RNA polymerase I specific transcription initiation factor RRN3 [Fragilaria crotonensis]|nr:RNA polymerase I specific transcription initiation factor RRN3 [Fragilaria crotonensis]
MCFRGTDAVQYFREAVKYWENTDKTRDSLYPDLDHIDIAPERWEKVCGHKLQPLRFCLESVREEFIFFAESFTLLPPKLLKNLDLDAQLQSSRPKRRGKLINTPVTSLAGRRQTGGVGGLGRGSNPLDSFFPFDPYLLKQSHIFVDSLYRNWEGRVDGDDVMLEDSDDDADLDDGHDVESDDDDDDDTTDASEAYTHMPVSADSTVFSKV